MKKLLRCIFLVALVTIAWVSPANGADTADTNKPPPGFWRCGFSYGGTNPTTWRGDISTRPNIGWYSYYVKIIPLGIVGWSGSVKVGSKSYPAYTIPPFGHWWYQSSTSTTPPKASPMDNYGGGGGGGHTVIVHFVVEVNPDVGQQNSYSIEIWIDQYDFWCDTPTQSL